jgi:hypothetical protein
MLIGRYALESTRVGNMAARSREAVRSCQQIIRSPRRPVHARVASVSVRNRRCAPRRGRVAQRALVGRW